jgi:hypothetical protein
MGNSPENLGVDLCQHDPAHDLRSSRSAPAASRVSAGQYLSFLRRERQGSQLFGVAALLEGAPILTLDLDALIDRDPQNLDRVMAALGEIKESDAGHAP